MLPQRSQYFSSILCGREDSNFALIVGYPFFDTKALAAARPQRLREMDSRQACEDAGDRARFFFEGLFLNERLRRSLVGLPYLARSIGSDYCFGFDPIT
jgi:hypothetical protein